MAKANEYRFEKFNFKDLENAPSNPIENTLLLYARGGKFYFLNSLGVETAFPLSVNDFDLSEYAKNFLDLEDSPMSYVGQGDKFIKVKVTEDGLEFGEGDEELIQATETVLGGIKAKEKTTESSEVAIDSETGKLYAPSDGGGGEIELPNFMSLTEHGFEIYTNSEKTSLIATIGEIIDTNSIIETSLVPTMTSNSAPNGIVTVNSYFSNADDYDGWRAFNKIISDMWVSATNINQWIAYEFINPKIVNKYKLRSSENYETAMAKNWTFEGWDGTQWIILDTRINQTSWSWVGEIRSYEFTNNSAYKKYRLNISSNNGYDKVNIAEIELIEISVSFDRGIFTDQYLKSLSGSILPTASVDYRRQIFTLLGGAGVADISYICIKDSTDAYVWKEI